MKPTQTDRQTDTHTHTHTQLEQTLAMEDDKATTSDNVYRVCR